MAEKKEIRETDLVVPIPVVDVGNLYHLSPTEFDLKDPKLKRIADDIAKALHEHGFIYLSNHGIPQDVVARAFAESEKFFNLPMEIKEKSAKGSGDASIHFHGYASAGRETLDTGNDNVKEWKETFDFFTMGYRPYPHEDAPNFAPTLQTMEKKCRHLETKLLRLIALALGLEDTDYFLDRCQNLDRPEKFTSGSLLRATLYPPIPEDLKNTGTWIGCNEHTDWGVLTLLFQDDVGGLEVKTAQGDWVKATPIPNTIVCNTGGLLEHWTGGYFPATPHRVHVRPFKRSDIEGSGQVQSARQSIIFFLQPDDEVIVEAQVSEILPRNEKYQPISAGEYFKKKSRLAYGQQA